MSSPAPHPRVKITFHSAGASTGGYSFPAAPESAHFDLPEDLTFEGFCSKIMSEGFLLSGDGIPNRYRHRPHIKRYVPPYAVIRIEEA
jgi:hypothetical protein